MKIQKQINVLIAEDDPLVAEMITDLLRKRGGYIIAGYALDGNEAVEQTHSLRPDVVLMDITMPNCDGITAAQQIFDECPTPVVVLTAYESQEMIERASQAGVGAYLVKPPKIQELERAIIIAVARFDDLIKLKLLNAELRQTIEQIKTLSGLLPMCASCKKIRDDDGYWQRLEVYFQTHTDVQFTHGLCPACARELYPELDW